MSTKRAHVAIIGAKGFPGFGGSARAVEQIVEHLNHSCTFTLYTIQTHMQQGYQIPGVRIISFRGVKNKKLNTLLYYLKSLLHALVAGRYSVVHVQHLYAGFIVPFLRIRYKVITSARGLIPKDDDKWSRLDKTIFTAFEWLACRSSSAVTSVSLPHVAYLQKLGNKPVSYIPNGVSVDCAPAASCNSGDNAPYMLFASARIIRLKGLHTLLDALHHYTPAMPLRVIGDMNHVATYRDTIEQKARGLAVEFLPLIKEKQQLMKQISGAFCFVFPSFNEGLSNMLLEAASQKTPIIASDIPENKSVFSETLVTYFTVGDPVDLAEKIKWVIDNAQAANVRANSAYNYLCKHYCWPAISQQYQRLYERFV